MEFPEVGKCRQLTAWWTKCHSCRHPQKRGSLSRIHPQVRKRHYPGIPRGTVRKRGVSAINFWKMEWSKALCTRDTTVTKTILICGGNDICYKTQKEPWIGLCGGDKKGDWGASASYSSLIFSKGSRTVQENSLWEFTQDANLLSQIPLKKITILLEDFAY